MMPHILLSLVGEQTIPLVQFIQALPPAREYWFVETKRTRDLQCVVNIAKACGISQNKIKTTLVAPEALSFQPPAHWSLPAETRLHLNLTSGTKPMMLSVYQAYEALSQAWGYYIPIGSATAAPVQAGGRAWPLPQLNLKTYLRALGFAYTSTPPNKSYQQKALALFKEIVVKGSPEKVPEIYQAQGDGHKATDKRWYAGEWWEDYLYAALKKDLSLPADAIAQGVKLEHCLSKSRTESDNELDVVFVYQNRLYAAEGKVYAGIAGGKRLTDPIYKLGTILKNMGLQAAGLVCLCANIRATSDQLDRLNYLQRISGVKTFLTLGDFEKGLHFKSVIQ